MVSAWLATILSVVLVSLISLIGLITLSIKRKNLEKILIYFVSFSAGALLGDVFIHLLPELVETYGFPLSTSLWLLGGILLSFAIEKIVHWRHCHVHHGEETCKPFAIMNLVGDGVHNFLDGIIIAASYVVSIPVGIATTIAVVLHEIPQEIGDFGVLLHGGFSRSKAVVLNLVTAFTALVGALLTLLASGSTNILPILIPFAAGNFIYIAGADLLPELHKHIGAKKAVLQLFSMALGIAVMVALMGIA